MSRFLIFIGSLFFVHISAAAQSQQMLDDQVKPIVASFKGKVSLFAKNLDTAKRTRSIPDGLSEVIVEGLASK